MKKAGHQQDYEKDDDFNALIRRISELPFTKPVDLDEAFTKFRQRADKLEKKRGAFSHELINYAQVQWRERFSVQDWNLYDINCLMVPSTNNGNEGANGRFLGRRGAASGRSLQMEQSLPLPEPSLKRGRGRPRQTSTICTIH